MFAAFFLGDAVPGSLGAPNQGAAIAPAYKGELEPPAAPADLAPLNTGALSAIAMRLGGEES